MKKKSISMIIAAVMIVIAINLPVYAAARDPYDGFSTTLLDGSNITTYNNSGNYLGSTGANNYFYYENINFGAVSPNFVELDIGVPEEYAGAEVQIRVDSPTGPLLASIVDRPSSFDTALTHTAPILTPVTGVHTLYILTGSKTANFFMIKFNKPLTGQDLYKVFESSDAYLDIYDSKYYNQINILKQLGFLEDMQGDYFYPKMFIKRKDFSKILFKVLNIEPNKQSEQVFKDVMPDNDCYDIINELAEQGIIVGYNDGYFYPENFITKGDAMVMICHLLGYGELAKVNGGYPQGYYRFANDQKLYNGLGEGEYLRNGEMAQLMCNMFEAYYLELDTILPNKTAKYKEIKGILSKTMSIYKDKGQVTATNNTALNVPDSSLEFDYVEINGIEYNVGETDAKALLGYDCDFYYTSDKDGENRVLTSIIPQSSVKVTNVSSADSEFEEISTSRISYYDENGKERHFRLESDTAVIYNGVAIDSALENFIDSDPFRGSIRYIQNRSGKDVIFIDEYINVRIGMVDKENEIISDSLSDTQYHLEDYFFYCVKDGEPVNYSRIKVKDIGMMYISKNKSGKKMVRLIIAGSGITGSISSKNNEEIRINDSVYKISPEFIARLKTDFDEKYTGSQDKYEEEWNREFSGKIGIGVSGVFFVNTFNEVVAYESASMDGDRIGMILSIAVSAEEEEPSYIRILTADNEKIRYQIAEKSYIDGIKQKNNKIIAESLNVIKGLVINTPVRYRLNDDEQVIMLDTELHENGGQRDSLKKLYSSTAYNYGSNTRILINSSTGKGTIPFASDGLLLSKWTGVMPEQYTFTRGGLSTSGNSGDIYTLNEDNETCDIFVWINRGMDYSAKSMVLDRITSKLNKDDEVYYSVTGIIGNETVEYPIMQEILDENSAMQVIVNTAKRGDCLRIGTDSKNQINSIDLLYLHDGSQQIEYNGTTVKARVSSDNRVWSDGGQYYRAVFATVAENTGDYLKLSLGDTLKDDIEYVYTKNINVVKYNPTRNALEDGYSSTAIQKGDKVFIYISDRNTRTIVVYKQ